MIKSGASFIYPLHIALRTINRVEICRCKYCGKPFLRRTRVRCVTKSGITIRNRNCITCSKKCSQALIHVSSKKRGSD